MIEKSFDYQHLAPSADETLERLIAMTNQTCLVALNKALGAIRGGDEFKTYTSRAWRARELAERMVRAVYEVGLTLPKNQRAITR